ncbi:unnamed protein product, partial [Prorocentrum cordatum]
SRESCLALVDGFLDHQVDGGLGLLQAQTGSLGGGPCGHLCGLPPALDRSDVYDNALAAIYYVKRGRLEEARRILDVFTSLLYPGDLRPSSTFPGQRGGIQFPGTVYHGLPSGRPLTLLAAAYRSTMKARAGQYWGVEVMDGAVDTGNNAWAALAFAHYAAAAGAKSRPEARCYAAVARDVLAALANASVCGDSLGGYLGRLPPFPANYRSTEHNLDVAALARALGDAAVSAHAERFVRQMHARRPDYPRAYATGTGKSSPGEERCGSSVPASAPVAADAQFWTLLAGADPGGWRAADAVWWALQRPEGPEGSREATQGMWESDADVVGAGNDSVAAPRLNGTRFTNWGTGVQWEVTASATIAMVKSGQQLGGEADPRLARRIDEARNSLYHLLVRYGGVPASVLGGNYEAWRRNLHHSAYPGGSDTGIGWSYFRYLHVASTAWTGLLLLYQADAASPVLEDANPLGLPAHAVPHGRADLSCLPPPPRRTA